MTQCDLILQHLTEHGSITSLEAMKNYGIMRLASRISDLKKLGFLIDKEMVKGENRNGDSICFARYSLKEQEQYG